MHIVNMYVIILNMRKNRAETFNEYFGGFLL